MIPVLVEILLDVLAEHILLILDSEPVLFEGLLVTLRLQFKRGKLELQHPLYQVKARPLIVILRDEGEAEELLDEF